MRRPAVLLVVAGLLVAAGCSSDRADPAGSGDVGSTARPVGGAAALAADATWQWQLQGEVNEGYDVDVYDIDLFDVPDDVIARLHADDRVVVCYFSAGSLEDWRPDAGIVAPVAAGEPLEGYEDERWLDVRHPSVRALATGRLDRAVERGCDGVEPDNVDGYANPTGFALSAGDQLDFNRFLAEAAHERGLLVGLKNDLDQIPELVADVDFAVNEQCFELDECDALTPFVAAGKPVFQAEYEPAFRADHDALCTEARERGLATLVLLPELDDGFRVACDG